MIILQLTVGRISMGSVDAMRGYICQAIIAIIECLERDDWDAIELEPATEDEKVDIQLYRDKKVISAISVKSSINAFSRVNVEKWLEELKQDAVSDSEYHLYLVGDNYTASCESYIRNIREVKKIPFSNLDLICRGKLITYIREQGIGSEVSAEEMMPTFNNLFAKPHLSSISDRLISRDDFKSAFVEALPVRTASHVYSTTSIASWDSFNMIHGSSAPAMFEKAVEELLRIENYNNEVHGVVDSRDTDGMDLYVHQEGSITVYQCKYFLGDLNESHWQSITRSFEAALKAEGTKIHGWSLFIPKEMNKKEFHRFNEFKAKNNFTGIEIHCVDGNEIINRMKFCDREKGTQLIEKYFSAPIVQKHFTDKGKIKPLTSDNRLHNSTYIPRYDLLRTIEEVFRSQTGKKRITFLSGVAGCGKSELARAYADKHSNEYEEIFWLTCSDGTLPELMELMNEADTLCEVTEEDVVRFSENILIIVDNCNRDDAWFFHDLENGTGSADILITTRLNSISGYESFVPVRSDDQGLFAYQVFFMNYCRKPEWGKAKTIEKGEEQDVLQICWYLQCNPFLVSLIACRLRDYNDLSISECADKIKVGNDALARQIEYNKDNGFNYKGIIDTHQFQIDDFMKYPFNNVERELLTVLSIVPSLSIDREFIFLLLTGDIKSDEYDFSINRLINFGWLKSDGTRISIHSLVSDWICHGTDNDILIKDSEFFENVLKNFLRVPYIYARSEINLISKMYKLASCNSIELRIAVLLFIGREEYKKLFLDLYPNTLAGFFLYVDHGEERTFLFSEVKKNTIIPLISLSRKRGLQDKAVILAIDNRDSDYSLDLRREFYGQEIEEIPAYLCYRDQHIKSLMLSERTRVIGRHAFTGCHKLAGALFLPDTLLNIGSSAYQDCDSLSGKLIFPNQLEIIGDNAFKNCSSLIGELYLPDSLIDVGEGAFEGCSGLSGSIIIPENLIQLKKAVFKGCTGFNGNLLFRAAIQVIDDFAFSDCTSLNGELYFPKSLNIIGTRAFENCSCLNGIPHLPETLAVICDEAFLNCRGLSGEIHLSESIYSVGKNVFTGCTSLSVKAPPYQFYESREFIRELFQRPDKVRLNECKVVFLGDADAGKSHAISRIINDGKKVFNFDGNSTPGINITPHKEMIGGNEILVHYWDFGAQEILHSMHHMFMTSRTLYVVFINARGNLQDEGIQFWLHEVYTHAPDAPILLVINKIDQNPSASINEKRLREYCPQIKAIVKTSVTDDSEKVFTEKLINTIHELINNMPAVNISLPVAWKGLLDYIREETWDFKNQKPFSELCNKYNISDYQDVREGLRRKLEELGMCYFYKEDASSDYVILKPEWILNAIYIILFNGSQFSKNGVITREKLDKILSMDEVEGIKIKKVRPQEKYEGKQIDSILNTIRAFGLSFQIEPEKEFIPMLCERDEKESWVNNENHNLHMIMRYEYKPNHIFQHLIVTIARNFVIDKVWYSGALLKDKDIVSILIYIRDSDLHIQIASKSEQKFDAHGYLNMIHNNLSLINQEQKAIADELVVYSIDGKEAVFFYDELIGCINTGINYIYSRGLNKRVAVRDVLQYSNYNLDEQTKELLRTVVKALEKLQDNIVFYNLKEDYRNTYIRDLLEMRGYICKDQNRGGYSSTANEQGERDILIHDKKDRIRIIYEALNLNLKSFADSDKDKLDEHINRLMVNYNPVGYPILILVAYVGWSEKDFYNNAGSYEVHVFNGKKVKYVVKDKNKINLSKRQFMRCLHLLYDCNGIIFNIYHFVVRVAGKSKP